MVTPCGREPLEWGCLVKRVHAAKYGWPAACAGCERGGAMLVETPRPATLRGTGRPRKARPVLSASAAPEKITTYAEAEEIIDGLAPVPAAAPASAGAYPEAGEAIDGLAQAAPSVEIIGVDPAAGPDWTAEFPLTPETAAEDWLGQVADPAAPADGQAAFLRGMFAANPAQPQEEHEDGQAQAGAMPELQGGVGDGDRPGEHENALELGNGGELPGLRSDAVPSEQEQHAAPEALAQAEPEGQAPGEPEAARGRSSACGVDEAAPRLEKRHLAILRELVATLCAKRMQRTSLLFLQSEFNALAPTDLAIPDLEVMARLVTVAGLRQVRHLGRPGVILEELSCA